MKKKHWFILLIALAGFIKSFGQITNIKAGLWSDPTTWNNNFVPADSTVVSLDFDVTVDINATCKSLHANGHSVTVNSGVQLSVVGDSTGAYRLNAGLVAYYPFDNGVVDESGNGYNLTIQGPVASANRFGKMQKAYKFNGTSDYMIIPKLLKADSLREFTISVWVRIESLNYGTILSFLSKGTHICSSIIGLTNEAMQYSARHLAISQLGNGNCTTSIIKDSIGNPLHTWCHIVLVQRYQSESREYLYSQYFNGRKLKLASSGYYSNPVITSFGEGGIIGGNNTSGNYDFIFDRLDGDIDDIRVYNRALPDNEVGLLYNLSE